MEEHGGEHGGEDEFDEADEPEERTWKRDLAIVVGVFAAFVVVTWVAVSIFPWSGSAEPADLKRFDEIDLGDLEGEEVTIGTTRSTLLPVVVPSDERGETSLQVIDVLDGTVTDAGPIPVDGWLANVFPRASERYVGVLANVCAEEPYEGDGTDECGEGMPSGVLLAIYDVEADQWATLPIDEESNQVVGLADVDGATATLQRYASLQDEPDTWSKVALDAPLELGAFTEDGAPRPNGLIASRGTFDGWGWKAKGAREEGDTTWTGEVQGQPKVEIIANDTGRAFAGAGPCLAIVTRSRTAIEHLHRVCSA